MSFHGCYHKDRLVWFNILTFRNHFKAALKRVSAVQKVSMGKYSIYYSIHVNWLNYSFWKVIVGWNGRSKSEMSLPFQCILKFWRLSNTMGNNIMAPDGMLSFDTWNILLLIFISVQITIQNLSFFCAYKEKNHWKCTLSLCQQSRLK